VGCDNIRVIITGFYTAANRGDEGILRGMVHALSGEAEGTEIEVLAHHDKVTSELTGLKTHRPLLDTEKAVLLPLYLLQIIYLTIWVMKYRIGVPLPLGRRKNSMRAILEADLVLVSGGGFLNDNYKPAILGRLYELFLAHLLKKPVGIYAHSIGPFNSRFYRLLARLVFRRAQIITVREKVSEKIVRDMDLFVPNIVVPDAAFAMPARHKSDDDVIIQLDGEDKELVSISVREWDYYAKEGGHEQYIETMSKVADSLVDKGYRIIFCSTCSGYGGYSRDDRITAEEVIEGMRNKNSVHVIRDHTGPHTLIEMYSRMKFHIGTRMHSNIFALLGGTPVVAIGYEHKTLGMMERLGMKNLVVDINEFSDEDVQRRIDDVLLNYDDYKGQISRIIPELRREAVETPDLILDAIKGLRYDFT
jgi:colanic acid/amylovoran biosynthesis protein